MSQQRPPPLQMSNRGVNMSAMQPEYDPLSRNHRGHSDDYNQSSPEPSPPPRSFMPPSLITGITASHSGYPDQEREEEPIVDDSRSGRGIQNNTAILTSIITPSNEIMSFHNSYRGKMTGAEAEQALRRMEEPCYLTRFSVNHNKYVLSILTKNNMEEDLQSQDFELIIDNDNNHYEITGTGKRFESVDMLFGYYEHNPLNESIDKIGVPCVASEATREVRNKKRTSRQRQTRQLRTVNEEEEDLKRKELDIINMLMKENASYRKDLIEQQKIREEKMEAQQKELIEQQKIREEKMEAQQKVHREQIDKLIETNRRRCTVM